MITLRSVELLHLGTSVATIKMKNSKSWEKTQGLVTLLGTKQCDASVAGFLLRYLCISLYSWCEPVRREEGILMRMLRCTTVGLLFLHMCCQTCKHILPLACMNG